MKKCPFLTFMLGVTVGMAAGVLLAPHDGKQTRDCIRKKANHLSYDLGAAKDTIKDTVSLYTGIGIQPVEGQSVFEREFDVE